MFKGKLSIFKNSIYLIILGLHTFLYAYFLYYSWFNYAIFIINLISFIVLIWFATYSFFSSKSYFYQFYIAIIISSIPIVFILTFSAFLIVPEVIILVILFYRGTEQSEKYLQIRVNKKANLYQHDPAILRYNAPALDILGSKMDIIWNPNGTVPLSGEDRLLENKTFNLKIQLIALILASMFFVSSVLTITNYYNISFVH